VATFGYTTAPSGTGDSNVYIMWFKAQSAPASNGSLTSITMQTCAIASGTDTLLVALYSDDGENPSHPLNLLASISSGGGSLTAGAYGNTTSNLSYAGLTAGTQYWFAVATSAWSDSLYYYYDSSGTGINFTTNDFYFSGTPVAAFPSTASGGSLYPECAGLYATYTPSGGGADWRKEGYWWDNPYNGRNRYWRPRRSSIFRPKTGGSPDLWRKAA
jgi:hypothetical protein